MLPSPRPDSSPGVGAPFSVGPSVPSMVTATPFSFLSSRVGCGIVQASRRRCQERRLEDGRHRGLHPVHAPRSPTHVHILLQPENHCQIYHVIYCVQQGGKRGSEKQRHHPGPHSRSRAGLRCKPTSEPSILPACLSVAQWP